MLWISTLSKERVYFTSIFPSNSNETQCGMIFQSIFDSCEVLDVISGFLNNFFCTSLRLDETMKPQSLKLSRKLSTFMQLLFSFDQDVTVDEAHLTTTIRFFHILPAVFAWPKYIFIHWFNKWFWWSVLWKPWLWNQSKIVLYFQVFYKNLSWRMFSNVP